MRCAEAHRCVDKLGGEVNEGSQACGQIEALGAALHTLVEDLDEVLQAVLVHGVNEGQVSHDEVQDGNTLWNCFVLLSRQVDLCFGVLCLLDPL